MSYQRTQAEKIRQDFFTSRGLDSNAPSLQMGEGVPPDFGTGEGNNQPGMQGSRSLFGGGSVGEIKSIDGNTLVISNGQRETKVTLTDTTAIEKTTAGVLSDLQTGTQVMVTGERNADGIITAVQITILPAGSFFMGIPEDVTPYPTPGSPE